MKIEKYKDFNPFCPYCLNTFVLKDFPSHVISHKEFFELKNKPVFRLFENPDNSALLDFDGKHLRTFSVVFLFCPLCMKNTESLYYHRFGECGHGLSISDSQAKFIDDNIHIFARKYKLNIFYAAFIVYLRKEVSVREIQKILQEKGLSYRHSASNWDALETVLNEIFNSSLDVEIPDGGNFSGNRIYYCKPASKKKTQKKSLILYMMQV